jgi:hypothetical protein
VDRLSQADAVLAAALVYSPAAVIPGRAPSPMDCDTTIRVTRTVVGACDLRAQESSNPARDGERPAGVESGGIDPGTVESGGVDPGTVESGGPEDRPTAVMLDDEMVRASRGRRAADQVSRTA